MTKYDKFEALEKLLKMECKEPHHYEKIVMTGECSLYDYKRGFLNVSIRPVIDHQKAKRKISQCYQVRVVYSTIDDGTFGGWSGYMTKENAEYLCDELAEYYKQITSLPSDEEVNNDLIELGLYLEYEG